MTKFVAVGASGGCPLAGKIRVRHRAEIINRVAVAAHARGKIVLAAEPVAECPVPFRSERQPPCLSADLAHDVKNVGVEVPPPAERVRLALPVAIGDGQDDRLGRVADAGKQRLKRVGVDVGRGAFFETFEIGPASHRVEQRVSEAEAQQVGLIRDALHIEAGPISLVEVEHAARVDVTAPFLSLAGPAAA